MFSAAIFNNASFGITETNIGDFALDPLREPSEEIFLYRGCFTLLLTLDIPIRPLDLMVSLLQCLKVVLNPSILLSPSF